MLLRRVQIEALLSEIESSAKDECQINVDLFKLQDGRDVKLVHLTRSNILENKTPEEAEEIWLHLEQLNNSPIQIWAAENRHTYSEDPEEEHMWLNGYVSATTGNFVPRPQYDQVPNFLRDTEHAMSFKYRWFGSDGLVTCIFERPSESGSQYTVHLVEPDSGDEFAKCHGDTLATAIIAACLTAVLNGWKRRLGCFELVEVE